MKRTCLTTAAFGATALLGACAEQPVGPTITVMPAPYKPFEVFMGEEQTCRGYAQTQINGTPANAAANSTATGAIAGTALGAASGALIGQSGQAAGVGAGIGLLAGTAIGSGYGSQSQSYLQYRYNVAYEQCMYAKGNQVPGYAAPTTGAPPQNAQQPYPPPPSR